MGKHHTEAANPWLAATNRSTTVAVDPEPSIEWDDVLGGELSVLGPQHPLGIPFDHGQDLPRSPDSATDSRLHVVGAHGGAGTTTVSRLLGPAVAVDAGRLIPGSRWLTPHVLLVARTNGAGFEAVSTIARAWAAGRLDDISLLGLVLVADGPKLTKHLRQEASRVARMTPRCWKISWREDWREVATPTLDPLNRRIHGTVNDIIKRTQTRNTKGSN